MRRDWRDCGPASRGGGKRSANYDVLLTVVKNKTVKGEVDADWKLKGISFTFKNKGYARIVDHNGTYLRISMIQPTSTRIYFDFMPDDYRSKQLGLKLSKKEREENSFRTVFPFKTKREHDIVAGYWIGEYQLQYDADCSNYYIENKSVRGIRP